jgi:hypothetical protein
VVGVILEITIRYLKRINEGNLSYLCGEVEHTVLGEVEGVVEVVHVGHLVHEELHAVARQDLAEVERVK